MSPKRIEVLEQVADCALKLVLAQTCRRDSLEALQNLVSALLDLRLCEVDRAKGDSDICGND